MTGNELITLVDRALASWNVEPSKARLQTVYDAWMHLLHDLNAVDCQRELSLLAVEGSPFLPRPGELRRRVLKEQLNAPAPLEAWMQFQAMLKAVTSGTHNLVELHPCVISTVRKIGGGYGLHTNGDRDMFVGVYTKVVSEFESGVLAVPVKP